MVKFFCSLTVVLVAVALGEYYYFTHQLQQWYGSDQAWRTAVETAQRAATDATNQLAECQARPNPTELLQQVTTCRKFCPQAFMNLTEEPTPLPLAAYANWPDFLRPDANGVIQIIRQFFLNSVMDLNALKVLAYSEPTYRENAWMIDTTIRALSNDGKYRLHIFHFRFRKDGALLSAEETPGAVIE